MNTLNVPINEYDLGNAIVLAAQFASPAGVPLDPTGITAALRNPDASVVRFAYGVDSIFVKDGPGSYHITLTPTQVGTHYYEFAGSGAVIARKEWRFRIRANQIALP